MIIKQAWIQKLEHSKKWRGLETLPTCTSTSKHSKQENLSRAGFVSRKLVAWDQEVQTIPSSELRSEGLRHQRHLPTTNSRK